MSEDLPITVESRRQARIAALPEVYKTQHERLAYELAMGLDDSADIFQRHGYGRDDALALLELPEFAKLLDRISREVRENGITFRAKARVMAEDLLQHGYEIATDELASAAVRADLIQWFARVGDLEPAAKKVDTGASGGLSLTITFTDQAPVKVITHEPQTIEQEK